MPPVVCRFIVVGVGFCSMLLAHCVAQADIFHCVDAGVHVYRDSPCPTGTRLAGITVSAPVEPPVRQYEDPRIESLEREVAELRAALQSMQVAAVPAAAEEPAYPAAPVQQPVYITVPVPEPVYTTLPAPVVIVQGCQGRACGHRGRPNHDGPDHRPDQHKPGDRQGERHAELRRDESSGRGRRP